MVSENVMLRSPVSRSSKNPTTVGSRVSAVKPPSATCRAFPLVIASTSESKASSMAIDGQTWNRFDSQEIQRMNIDDDVVSI